MKKLFIFSLLLMSVSACNYHYETINPSYLCGKLIPQPSPYDANDTVVAMKVNFPFHSDMNGLTYFLLKENEMISILDREGKRKDSVILSAYFSRTFILYPNNTLLDMPQEALKCDLCDMKDRDTEDLSTSGCLNISEGYLIFYYEMRTGEGSRKKYNKILSNGETIHLYEIDGCYFEDATWDYL